MKYSSSLKTLFVDGVHSALELPQDAVDITYDQQVMLVIDPSYSPGSPVDNAAISGYLLKVAKEEKVYYIEQMRDAACYMNVQALGYTWQADLRSQDLLNGAINLASRGGPLPAYWRSSENYNLPITDINQLVSIAEAIAANVNAAYAKSWDKKAQIEGSSTPALVESISW